MSDHHLVPLEDKTIKEWRECAVWHEENSYQKSIEIGKLEQQLKDANAVIDHCENILVKNYACDLNTVNVPIEEYKEKYTHNN